MNRVQIWFIIIAGLLGIGIPFLFLGVQLPSAMHSAIMTEAAEYVILDEEDQNFWAVIPGRTGLNDTKMYYVYHCNNPEEVAARGVKPNFTEVGPFKYSYTHELDDRVYTDDGGVKNSRVSFTKKFAHKYDGNPEDLLKEYRVLNVAGLKRWANIKNKPRFQMAIEGFFETFFYARNNLPRDFIIRDIISYYHKVDPIYDLTKDLQNVSRSVREAVAYDRYYGLLQEQNVYEWSTMCDMEEPYIEHEIMVYFGFSIPNFEIVKSRFCHEYLSRHDKFITKMCENLPSCSYYNISFSQWMYGNVIQGKTYHDITFKSLFGIFEFKNYLPQFFAMLNPDYKGQFEKVKWDDKSYHYLLDTLYEYPDFKTDDASLLLYDNMRRLYDAGKLTKNPFKAGPMEEGTGAPMELDLSRFEHIASDLHLSKEQAFMMYSYFEYFVNNTVLLQAQGGNLGKERIANYGAMVYKDISSYYTDFLDVVLYTRALHHRAPSKTCPDMVKYYFTIPETQEIMHELITALCNNKYFDTDLSTPVGWKYFVEASSYPYHFHYRRLEDYLTLAVTNFTNVTFDAMIFKDHGAYWANLDNIKALVKKHYTDKTSKKACENDFSPYCSKRELFFTQFYQSAITMYPYPESNLPASQNIADWWEIIKPYMDYTLSAPKSARAGVNGPIPLPDQPIIVPVELSYLQKYYGDAKLSKTDLYNCFHLIGLYDTDVLYNVLLNIHSPDKVGKYRPFATGFFYNATRYLIRNVQFGPMFDKRLPEETYFGYFNHFLDVEHRLLDYLEGDDCTVNPWIGYNPVSWDIDEKTFEHYRRKHKMFTGSENNADIRKYMKYYGNDNVTFRRLERDITGDECAFSDSNPFLAQVPGNAGTDGLQFPQYAGKTKKGDINMIMEETVHRPLKLERKTGSDYKFRRLEVNDYVMDFSTEYGCEHGVYIVNAIDMTSFFQMHSIVSRPQLTDISEPGLIKPIIKYTHSLDNDFVPEGARKEDSYFVIEPYTGITMQYAKKMMTSMVIYYDELYDKLPDGGLGELVPYYATYEYAKVSDSFADDMADNVANSQSTRQTVSVTFTILGTLFVFGGVCMIIRACFFEPEEGVSTAPSTVNVAPIIPPTTETKVEEPKPIAEQPTNPAAERLLVAAEGEDLQQEPKPVAEATTDQPQL